MGERIIIEDRIGSAPRERGSASGQSCPDIFLLQGDETGVIGQVPNMHEQVPEQTPDQGYLLMPDALVYGALASRHSS
jgi:hypothetical protein